MSRVLRYILVLMVAIGATDSLRAQQSLYRIRLQDALSHTVTIDGPTTGFGGTWTLRLPSNVSGSGSLLYASDASGQLSWLATGSNTQVLTLVGGVPTWAAPATNGTVASVGLSMPSIFSVSNSPVTLSGTLTATLNTQSPNLIFAGPSSGGAAIPTFRALTSSDIPALSYVTSVGLSLPSIFTVSGSPVTSSGTLTSTLASQSAKTFFAAPNASAGVPTFRTIVASDIPALSYVTSVSLSMPTGFAVANSPITSSGTLAVTTTLNGVIHGNGSGFTASNVNLTSEVTGTLPVTNGGSGTATQFTPGSVVFAGASGIYSQNNANFFWDNSNNRLGIGTSSPASGLDVARDFATREYNYTTSLSGSNNNLNFDGAGNLFGFVRIQNASAAFTLTTIAGPQNGKRITIYNATSQNMTIANQSAASGATAANKIITGTGSDVTIPASGSANLIYSATDSRWIMTSSSIGNSASTGTGSYLQVTPSDPDGTNQSGGRMMGLGSSISFTPSKSGVVMIVVSASGNNSADGDGGWMQIRYGTGSAPSNGAQLTGTAVGNQAQGSPSDPGGSNSASHHETIPMTCNAVVSGLTVGTTYWFDLAVGQIGGGTAKVLGVSASLIEM